MTLISIIVPTFNDEDVIYETLDSILKQEYTNWECFVIDDGSVANIEQIVGSYCNKDSRFTFFKRPKNKSKGANTCRNIGFTQSKGEFVMFLDADDILSEKCLQNRMNAFKEDDTLDFVIANTAFYSDGVFLSEPICNYPIDHAADQYLNLFLKYELPWTVMSVLWKKDSITNISFDETLPRLQDVDFHIQVLLQDQLKCIRLNEVDNFYRSNRGGKTSKEYYKKVVIASKLFFEKYLTNQYLNSDQKKQFRRFIILFLIKHIYPYQKELNKDVNTVDRIIKKSNVFSFKELLLLKIYKFIIKYDLNTKTGLGIHRLTKGLKKGLNYDR